MSLISLILNHRWSSGLQLIPKKLAQLSFYYTWIFYCIRNTKHEKLEMFSFPFFLQTRFNFLQYWHLFLFHFLVQNCPHTSCWGQVRTDDGTLWYLHPVPPYYRLVFADKCINIFRKDLALKAPCYYDISLYLSALTPHHISAITLSGHWYNPIALQALASGFAVDNSLDAPFHLWNEAHGVLFFP